MTRLNGIDPERYPRDGTKAFYMNEADYLKAAEDAEGRGESVTAVYHSHVDAGVYFSEMDQEFAEHELFPFPGVAHFVIAVDGGPMPRCGVFERPNPNEPFIGRKLEAIPT